jgi:hypothetical protein
MNLPIPIQAGFGLSLDEIVPVHIMQENAVALIATAHYGVNCGDTRLGAYDEP